MEKNSKKLCHFLNILLKTSRVILINVNKFQPLIDFFKKKDLNMHVVFLKRILDASVFISK